MTRPIKGYDAISSIISILFILRLSNNNTVAAFLVGQGELILYHHRQQQQSSGAIQASCPTTFPVLAGATSSTRTTTILNSRERKRCKRGLTVLNMDAATVAVGSGGTFADASFSVLADSLGSSYTYCLDNFYFATQSATGGIFSTIGDIVAQTTSSSSPSSSSESDDSAKEVGNSIGIKNYDPKRTFRYFLKGLGGGIIWTIWFDFADCWSHDLTRQILAASGYDTFLSTSSTTATTLLDSNEGGIFGSVVSLPSFDMEQIVRTLVCIVLEQFLVCPIIYSMWDIPLPALLRGLPAHKVPNQIRQQLGPLLTANAKVWTFVNVIIYNAPLEFQLLISNMADVVWQSINVAITSKDVAGTDEETTQAAETANNSFFEHSTTSDTRAVATSKISRYNTIDMTQRNCV